MPFLLHSKMNLKLFWEKILWVDATYRFGRSLKFSSLTLEGKKVNMFLKSYLNWVTDSFGRRQAIQTMPSSPPTSVASMAVSTTATATASDQFAVRVPQRGE